MTSKELTPIPSIGIQHSWFQLVHDDTTSNITCSTNDHTLTSYSGRRHLGNNGIFKISAGYNTDKGANSQQHGPNDNLKQILIMTSMTPIPIAVLSLGMDPTIPMRSMKKPIAPIPARYNGRRPIRPMTGSQLCNIIWQRSRTHGT
jgi:hypothetical protein